MIKVISNNSKGIIITLIAAAIFGATSPIAKYIYSFGMTASTMLALRFSLASIFLWIYIWFKRKTIKYKITKQQLIYLILTGGVSHFLTTMCYFTAITYIPVSLHIMIFYTYPFLVTAFSVFIWKERVGKIQYLAMFVAFVGLLLTISFKNIGLNGLGMVFSIIAALCNSGYTLLLGTKIIREVDSILTVAYASLFAAVSFITLSTLKGELSFDYPIGAWGGIAFLSLFTTAIGVIALSTGIKYIGSAKAAIICIFEPLEALILSVLFLGESLGIRQCIGVVFILGSIILIDISHAEPVTNTYQT